MHGFSVCGKMVHFHVLAADNYAKAKTLAGWKAAVDSRWNAVEIVSVNAGKGLDATVEAGKEYEMTVVIDEKGLDNAIGLESVIIRHEENEDRQFMVKAPAEGRDLQFFILNFEIMHYLCRQIPTSRRPPGF